MTPQTGADARDGREVFISYRTLDDMPPPRSTDEPWVCQLPAQASSRALARDGRTGCSPLAGSFKNRAR